MEEKKEYKPTDSNETIMFYTFPSDDIYYCSWFVVPIDWFIKTFREQWKIDNFLEWLNAFYDEYTWDDTWFIYEKALMDKVILEEGDDK